MAISKEATIWLQKANDDLLWTKASLDSKVWYGACFTAQQAIEKVLKGYLLGQGWELTKVHDLNYLLTESVKYAPELEIFREEIAVITRYYIETRYPIFEEFSQLTESEAKSAYTSANRIIAKIGSLLG